MTDSIKEQKAETDAEQDWLTTAKLLKNPDPDPQDGAWVAAIPHWFNTEILAHLLGHPPDETTEQLYENLRKLPFVERFGERGHNIHEVTREIMLNRWWQNERDHYKTLSGRAAVYFKQKPDDPTWQIERIYHLLINKPSKAADALRILGHTWNSSFQYTLVDALVQIAKEHVDAKPSRVEGCAKGWIFFWQGQVAFEYGFYHKALKEFTDAQDFADGDTQLETHCLKALGDAHRELDQYSDARKQYQAALLRYETTEDKEGKANCLLAVGQLHLRVREYDKAEVRCKQALEIYQEQGVNPVNEAHSLKNIGEAQQGLDKLDDAENNYKKALKRFKKLRGRLWIADCRLYLSGLYMRRKEYQKAQTEYNEILVIYAELDDKEGIAHCKKSLGDVQQKLHRPKAAHSIYIEALELYRKIDKKDSEADCLKSLGDMYKELEEYPTAQKWYDEALSLYREIDIKSGEANSLKDLADTYVGQRNYKAGREGYEAALTIYQEMTGAKEQTLNCLKAMTKMYEAWPNAETAQRYQYLLSTYQDIDDEQQAIKILREFLKTEGILQ